MEKALKNAFPNDEIKPIPKGKAGGDVVQKVFASDGQYCGQIIWESKNTNSWSNSWLGKLRNDQRRIKAELGVLVSKTLPKDLHHFARVDGVWITELTLSLCLAGALRVNLIQLALLRQSSTGKQQKWEKLYQYLSGIEFKQRVEAMVEAYGSMQDDLQKERQMMERLWAKREKLIQLGADNVAGMYGDMQAVLGQSLPRIKRLELPAPRSQV